MCGVYRCLLVSGKSFNSVEAENEIIDGDVLFTLNTK